MSVFNRSPRVLRNTLHALRKNDLENCEILICDDGSTVNYDEIRSYMDQYEMPYRWFRIEPFEYPPWTYTLPHPDGGVTNNPALAMNRLIELAEGRRLMFLSSDCMLPKDSVKMAKRRAGNYYYIASVMDQASNMMYVGEHRPLPLHFFACVKKEHVEAINGFDEEFLRGLGFEDNDFGVRLGLHCGAVMFDLRTMVVHQSHPPLAYSDGRLGFSKNEDHIRSKWGGLPWVGNNSPDDPVQISVSRNDHILQVTPRLK